MIKKIGISEVKLEWLNKRALALISIFAHVANKSCGEVINLRDDDTLSQVLALARSSNNAELIDIYQRIKREIKVSLSKRHASEEATQEVNKLSIYEITDKVQKQNHHH